MGAPQSPTDAAPEGTPHLDEQTHLGLDLASVVRLAMRTLPYLRPILRELRPLAFAVLPIVILFVPMGMLGADLFFNRMLVGQPVTPFEASLLVLDPARYVAVDQLGTPEREVLRDRLVITTALLTLGFTPFALWVVYRFILIRQRINQLLRIEMVENVQAQSMRFHAAAPVGDAIYRAYQDSAMVTGLMSMLVQPIGPLFGIVTGLAIGFLFDWRLPLVLALMYAALYWMALRTTPDLRRGFRRARERNSALMSRIQETLAAIKVVKAYGAEEREQQRFEDASRWAFDGAYEGRSRLALLGIWAYLISAIVPIGAGAYLALLAREGEPLAAGAALAFLGFAAWNLGAYTDATTRLRSWTGSARRLIGMWAKTQDMAIGMERALGHVDQQAEVQDAEDAVPLETFSDAVTFENVSFCYQPDRPVLREVDLVARAGTITALVGPTGSGKTTLVNLLLRLFDPDDGKIEIDGVDLRHIALASLRANIAIALQENLLFGTSIRENIRYAVPDASDEAVREAARIACADEFIERQAGGYDAALGERGARLSTGQRQRLSIARAVIKDAPILVLDEPTAALDAETELRVMRNLGEWGRGRAIFLITHRLSTIRRADQIVYLDNGRVIECGAPDDLMQKPGGAYRRFVELESDDDRPATESAT
jgi:ABC-type multidrug transport system fused ATPase/permease subunit